MLETFLAIAFELIPVIELLSSYLKKYLVKRKTLEKFTIALSKEVTEYDKCFEHFVHLSNEFFRFLKRTWII